MGVIGVSIYILLKSYIFLKSSYILLKSKVPNMEYKSATPIIIKVDARTERKKNFKPASVPNVSLERAICPTTAKEKSSKARMNDMKFTDLTKTIAPRTAESIRK